MTPISICVIAKNEEKHMDAFLSAIREHMKGYPYEVVLVDTGSTDRTVEIASRYNTKIFHFDWIDDFSAARNYSLSCASFSWVLVLDCDEYLTDIKTECFEQMMKQYPRGVGMIVRKNHCWSNGSDRIFTDDVNRFFCRKHYHYEDMIHEQLCANNGQPYEMVNLPVAVEHFGYNGTKEELEAKARRNNELLFRMLEEHPDDPYLYFQIGQSYNLIDETEKACEYYAKGLEFDVNPELEYVQLMVHSYGCALLNLKRYQEALAFENIYDAFATTPEFVCLMGQIYMKNGMLLKAMKEFLKATTFPTCDMEGANTFTPLYNMGRINEMMGDRDSAMKLYESCGSYPPAQERLKALRGLQDERI